RPYRRDGAVGQKRPDRILSSLAPIKGDKAARPLADYKSDASLLGMQPRSWLAERRWRATRLSASSPPVRARRERPRRRRPADQGDELAPLHSISSSARSRNDSGIVRPSPLAVVRLMTRSNFVGCSTGMSAGLAPCKILSTISAVRRNRSG